MSLLIHIVLLKLWLACVIVFGGGASLSEPTAPPDPLGSRAAGESWFDSDTNDYRLPPASALGREQLPDRNSRLASKRNWNWNWNSSFNWNWVLYPLMYTFIGVAILLVVIAIFSVIDSDRGFRIRRNANRLGDLSEPDRQKLSDLPFAMNVSERGLLEEVELAMQRQDFNRAMVFLFGHMLLELDKHRKLRIQRGKTNGMYLRELRSNAELHAIMQKVALGFEWVYFGKNTMTSALFQQYWQMHLAFQKVIQADLAESSQRDAGAQRDLGAAAVQTTTVLSLLFLAAMVGCNYQRPIAGYAECERRGNESLNGLTVFRRSCEELGFATSKIRSLSARTKRFQTIVWTPIDYGSPSQSAVGWLENWLQAKENRLLIYVGRDFEADEAYWKLVAERVPAKDRLVYQEEAALAHTSLDNMRSRTPPPFLSPWFVYEKSAQFGPIAKVNGPWSESSEGVAGAWFGSMGPEPLDRFEPSVLSTMPSFEARKAEVERLEEDSSTTTSPNATSTTPSTPPSEPTPPPSEPTPSSVVEEESLDGEENTGVMDEEVADSMELFDGQGDSADAAATPVVEVPPYQFERLLCSATGETLVFSIQRKDWSNSRILVVRNGSAILNFGAVQAANQGFLRKLIGQCDPGGRIAFLATEHDPSIFDGQVTPNKLLGFEMLTVWPLNMVTMLAFAIGILMILALLPLYGRPQALPAESTEDFGAHIAALGDLLRGSQDRNYAMACLRDYYVRVRKEANSSWALWKPLVPSVPEVSTTPSPTPLPSQSEIQENPS